MGKIFGISDLPVSTIMSPFKPIYKPLKKVVDTPNNYTASVQREVKSNTFSYLKKIIFNLTKHK